MSASASTFEGRIAVADGRRRDHPCGEENGTAASHEAAVPHGGAGVPARAEGVELLGGVAGSGYRRQPALVRRADGQTVQLTPLLFHLLEAIDGKRGYAELAAALSERIGKLATADDVRFLTEAKLRPLGLLRQPDGTEPRVEKTNPLLALRLKLVVSNPDTTRRLAAPFAALFRPPVVLSVLIAFALTIWWVAFEKGLASAAHQALYEPELLLLVFALTLLSAGFHELGHAAACGYSGARVGGMGVGLYLVWPAFYTDVTDSYRLCRRDRLRVDLGGLYFNAIFGVAILAAWAAVDWDALLLVIVAQLVQMARQLLPVVRFDGYHVLADLTGVPDLFAHIKPTLLGLLPTRWRRAEGKVLKTWARAVVTLWVLVVVPLLAALLVFVVVVLPRIVATAWDSLGLQWDAFESAWADADVSALTVASLSMLMISLPVVGIVYLLARVGRRTALQAWRATSGRPPLRVGAVLGAATLLATVAWTWAPDVQYRPIEPSERWSLSSGPPQAGPPNVAPEPVAVMQAAPTVETTPLTTIAVREPKPSRTAGRGIIPAREPEPREPGRRGKWMLVLLPLPASGSDEVASGPTIVPSEPPTGADAGGDKVDPTTLPPEPPSGPVTAEDEADPTLAASVPPPGPDTGTEPGSRWVFPFDPPRAPREGDNQAVAVNTVDGSTAVDVALALVWVTDGGPVENRNEAYALASCSGCRTVAVAFQVVLVIGYAQVVTPVNAAVALNYECEGCTTHALAVQLVATLTRLPSDETRSALASIWAQLEQMSANFELLPLEQVYAQLLSTRTRILEILAQDDGTAAPEATAVATETSRGHDDPDSPDVEDAAPSAPADAPATTPDATTTTAAEPSTPGEESSTSTTAGTKGVEASSSGTDETAVTTDEERPEETTTVKTGDSTADTAEKKQADSTEETPKEKQADSTAQTGSEKQAGSSQETAQDGSAASAEEMPETPDSSEEILGEEKPDETTTTTTTTTTQETPTTTVP
jgi:putative peptide zinc metalloprotease protein